MRALYVTDLHGCIWKYEALFRLAMEQEIRLVINGGDMYPKEGNLFEQNRFINGFLNEYFSRYHSAGIHHLGMPGNDDLAVFDHIFEETCHRHAPYVHSMGFREVVVEGFSFVGFNLVPDYPFRLKDRCRRDEEGASLPRQLGHAILSSDSGWNTVTDWSTYVGGLSTIGEELERLPQPNEPERTVYIIHAPPARLGLDVCADGRRVGSEAVYYFLLTRQPLFSLHGHIHESPWMTRRWYEFLGRTICIQPGQLEDLSYVLLDLSNRSFRRQICAREADL